MRVWPFATEIYGVGFGFKSMSLKYNVGQGGANFIIIG